MENQFLGFEDLPKGLITEKETAGILNVSLSCLRGFRNRNLIGHLKTGSKIYYTAQHIYDFLLDHYRRPSGGGFGELSILALVLHLPRWMELLPAMV